LFSVVNCGRCGRDRPLFYDLDEEELRLVQQPSLFIWGDGDVFGGPKIGERAVKVMPNAQIEVVSGGHLPWLDEPAFCTEVVPELLRAALAVG
jgi:pimeloyl-ACP methyl ester carboxylesterase